jgi:uncharacterized protein YraI
MQFQYCMTSMNILYLYDVTNKNMKRAFLILILFSIPIFLQAQPEIKITTANVNFRSSPETNSHNKICVISKGIRLLVNNENQYFSEWILIEYKGKIGYIYYKYLQTPQSNSYSSDFQDNSSNEESVKYYINSGGIKVQSPTYYDKPPAGASAQCRDGTYSFSLHRRGTCSGHGGVRKWL